MSDDRDELEHFSGVARLFPLPNLVLFPALVQALHVFEPRYRQMTADALADDRLIALALLRPGWEAHYEGRPALYPVACLGRIANEQRLDDGRYNLQLRGLSRVRIVEELHTGKLYRSARVELLPDTGPPAPEAEAVLRRRLLQRVPPWCSAQGAAVEVFAKLLKSGLPLGTVCDVITFALPLAVEFKQELLETLHVERRVRALLKYLETKHQAKPSPPPVAQADRKFPPDFSRN